jgi:hypothetical protein
MALTADQSDSFLKWFFTSYFWNSNPSLKIDCVFANFFLRPITWIAVTSVSVPINSGASRAIRWPTVEVRVTRYDLELGLCYDSLEVTSIRAMVWTFGRGKTQQHLALNSHRKPYNMLFIYELNVFCHWKIRKWLLREIVCFWAMFCFFTSHISPFHSTLYSLSYWKAS